MNPTVLATAGSQPTKQYKYTPITTFLFFTGLVTQRSPFSPYDTRYNARYLGGRPDMLADGLNVEVSNTGTIQRRPGVSPFSSATLSGPADSFYSFHQINGSSNPITVIADTAANVYTLTSTAATSIFTKGMGAGQAYFQGVGNTLYFGDGIEEKAWQGTGQARNWGIAIGSVNNATPATGGSFATDGSFGNAWSNPTNILVNDGNFAIVNVPPAGGPMDSLSATGFGFTVPSTTTILGIQVDVKGQSSITGLFTPALTIQLLKAGSLAGNTEGGHLPSSNGFVTFGGTSDLWGTSWTPADINNANFGVQVPGSSFLIPFGGNGANFQIDYIQITIYGFGGPSIAVSGSAGTFSAVTGYKYVFAYGNSNSGHISDPTNPSASTGVFTNKLNVSVSLTASTDSQVNQIRVFRTKDGGSVFFELPTSPYPNTTANITDNSDDSTLQTLNFFLSSPTLENSPPPSGAVKLTYHLGRVWVVVNNVVSYSAGPDVIIGNGNEAWPPLNFLTFPSTVNRLVPTSGGLIVFTSDDTWIIQESIAPFTGSVFEPNLGLLSYNALDIIGSRIFLYTSDKQFVEASAAGINEIGYAIGNTLESSFDPSKAYVASLVAGTSDKAVYIADGSANWFRCNWNQPPEGGPTWSPQATVGFGFSALVSIETSPGVHQLLIGGNDKKVYTRNTSVFSDNGAPYPAFVTIGSLVLAQPGQMAEVSSITAELQQVGTVPSVSVLMEEISGSFDNLPSPIDDPPRLKPSLTVMSKRYHLSTAQPPASALCRHMRMKVTFATEAVKNEILSLSVFGALHYSE